jgi:hypothetical protein
MRADHFEVVGRVKVVGISLVLHEQHLVNVGEGLLPGPHWRVLMTLSKEINEL